MNILFSIIGILIAVIIFGLDAVNEYEKGVQFTFGKYTGMIESDLKIIVPVLQSS